MRRMPESEQNSMKVRRLEQAEHGLTRPLYEEVFSEDSKRFIDYYYTEKNER